jgi:hypothetical protein
MLDKNIKFRCRFVSTQIIIMLYKHTSRNAIRETCLCSKPMAHMICTKRVFLTQAAKKYKVCKQMEIKVPQMMVPE